VFDHDVPLWPQHRVVVQQTRRDLEEHDSLAPAGEM
jgi:hypothetical protein